MLPFEFLMVLKYSYCLLLAVFTKSNTIKKCKKEQNWTISHSSNRITDSSTKFTWRAVQGLVLSSWEVYKRE
jgi:hypothetical protein